MVGSINTSTNVQTRAQETDGLPLPLMLTLRTLWGSFENTENIPMSGTVVGQNAIYSCYRPGPVEIFVDATDGACTKTLCTTVTCPSDIPPLWYEAGARSSKTRFNVGRSMSP